MPALEPRDIERHQTDPKNAYNKSDSEAHGLGFGALLRALGGAGAVKAQVDAMDVLKERLKKGKADAAGAEMETGYLVMLRLFLDPRAVALRKASLFDYQRRVGGYVLS